MILVAALALPLAALPVASCAPSVAHLCVRAIARDVSARRRGKRARKVRRSRKGVVRSARPEPRQDSAPAGAIRWVVNGGYRGVEPVLFGSARIRFDELALNEVPIEWNFFEDFYLPRLTPSLWDKP